MMALSKALFSIPARRWIFDFARKSEVLLSELDLMSSDERFLKPLPIQEYKRMDDSLYKPILSMRGQKYKRLATIAPLYIENKTMVVPIPCIIDTGAPTFMLLGTGAINALTSHKLIRGELTTRILKGTMIKNGREVHDPIIDELPNQYEDEHTKKDVRYNVLGIYALQDFHYVIDFSNNN